jgi:hypothetical protein
VLGMAGKAISANPDFVLPDGTFIELKLGIGSLTNESAKIQRYRMAIYQLLRYGGIKIRTIFFTKGDYPKSEFSQIAYENFFDTEFSKNAPEKDIEEIRSWVKKLE